MGLTLFVFTKSLHFKNFSLWGLNGSIGYHSYSRIRKDGHRYIYMFHRIRRFRDSETSSRDDFLSTLVTNDPLSVVSFGSREVKLQINRPNYYI